MQWIGAGAVHESSGSIGGAQSMSHACQIEIQQPVVYVTALFKPLDFANQQAAMFVHLKIAVPSSDYSWHLCRLRNGW